MDPFGNVGDHCVRWIDRDHLAGNGSRRERETARARPELDEPVPLGEAKPAQESDLVGRSKP
jgi:hypothetical protein